jgi:hypothetical protein
MNNTRNMTTRDVPLEILQRAEKRRRERELERFTDTALDGFFYILALVVFFWILKAFCR